VHYKLHLQDVPSDVRVHSITAVINQSYSVRSVKKPNLTSTPEPHKRRVFKLDGRTSMLRTDDFPTTALTETSGIFTVPNACHNSSVANGRTPRTVVISKETMQNDPSDLAFVPRGGSLIVSHLARLPNDDICMLRRALREIDTDRTSSLHSAPHDAARNDRNPDPDLSCPRRRHRIHHVCSGHPWEPHHARPASDELVIGS